MNWCSVGAAQSEIVDTKQAYDLLRARRVNETVNTDGLEADFVVRLALLCVACPELQIVSGFRTYAEQKALYDAWKNGTYQVPVVAVPGTSAHESGRAADVSTTRAWTELHIRAEVFGLVFPVASEAWHVETAKGIGPIAQEEEDMQADEIKTVQITVEGQQYNFADVIGWTLEQLNKLVRDVEEMKRELASR